MMVLVICAPAQTVIFAFIYAQYCLAYIYHRLRAVLLALSLRALISIPYSYGHNNQISVPFHSVDDAFHHMRLLFTTDSVYVFSCLNAFFFCCFFCFQRETCTVCFLVFVHISDVVVVVVASFSSSASFHSHYE